MFNIVVSLSLHIENAPRLLLVVTRRHHTDFIINMQQQHQPIESVLPYIEDVVKLIGKFEVGITSVIRDL